MSYVSRIAFLLICIRILHEGEITGGEKGVGTPVRMMMSLLES